MRAGMSRLASSAWLRRPVAAVVVALIWPAAAAGLTWSSPAAVGRQLPFARPGQLAQIACPSERLCVASDGLVWTSTDPGGGLGAWSHATLSAPVVSLSCPSGRLCAAVSNDEIFTTTDPDGGAAAWASVTPPLAFTVGKTQYSLLGISCPSTRLCVAWDNIQVAVSTNPTSPTSWKVTRVESGIPDKHDLPYENRNRLVDLSCASAHLCVGVDFAGRAITSTNPTGGARTWRYSLAHRGSKLGGVSCPTVQLCVAVDRQGNVVSSRDPGARASTWRTVHLTSTGGGFSHVRCPLAQLCVAALFDGTTMTATNPTGGAKSWVRRRTAIGYGISCPSARDCVAVDDGPDVATTTRPMGAPSSWTSRPVDGTNAFAFLSCTTSSWCVALPGSVPDVGDFGATSVDPAGGAQAWSTASVPSVTALSCPSISLCVAGDGSGRILTTAEPDAGASAWSSQTVVPTMYGCELQDAHEICGNYPGSVSAVACPTTGLCVALGDTFKGLVIATATNPSGPWSLASGVGGSRLSCPTTTLCVAVEGPEVIASTDPTGGTGAWAATAVGVLQLTDVSCTSAPLCVAVDDTGDIVTSTNPTGGTAAWSVANVDPGAALVGVSCSQAGLCAAIDNRGNVLTSTNPAGGGATWNVTRLDTGFASAQYLYTLVNSLPTAVSCPAANLCVVVDNAGNVFSGVS